MAHIAWSYSRLNDFETCPKMFYGKYISKEFAKDDKSPHLIRGRQVHETLERLMNRGCLDLTGDLSHLKDLIEMLRKGKTVKTEIKFAFDIKGRVVDWFNKSVWLRVIYDVAVINGKIAYIIDWKTGKVKDKNRDQLALFAATAFMAFPELEEVNTAYVWVDHPKAPPSRNVYYRAQFQGLLHDFRERSELIQMANQSGRWEATPTPLCSFCPAREDQCEHKRQRA